MHRRQHLPQRGGLLFGQADEPALQLHPQDLECPGGPAGSSARDGAPLDTERVQAVQALVCSELTSVLYMVIAHVAEIQRALLAASMAPDMPAAVVSQACTPRQRHALCRLDRLAQTVQEAALPSPALLVVGRVVKAAAMPAITSWAWSCAAA